MGECELKIYCVCCAVLCRGNEVQARIVEEVYSDTVEKGNTQIGIWKVKCNKNGIIIAAKTFIST